ncbi:twin-arginine translocase TatA/TatE family subunit [Candidatus Azoamicus ciliaticola]|uniref:Sec-independent protein translocase protein TatA n=1 Tax=Candidatus Azoamicus ciliaticola TaxID=2652803 RepID=A0A6J5JWM0_9GAMM|nr:twin-arginine translocase TatA/TatE family subunit [Candidatus Azoamicus ciliaticola]CAB3976424.1 Sec-independent protein translocase protein TatA [Candidatus Azoamicus ciliaticola]
MGFGSISPMSLLLIFLIIIVLFGTKKLRNIGEDLGHAFKSFRRGLQQIDDDKKKIENKKDEEEK